jgi:hypothetical protein
MFEHQMELLADDDSDYNRRLAAFQQNEQNYNPENKHCILQIANKNHTITDVILQSLLSTIRKQDDFCDWSLCVCVRLLYFDYGLDVKSVTPQLDTIRDTLRRFPFWPMCSTEKCKNTFCYWSENHSFMFLSSAHLFQQTIGVFDTCETHILRCALQAKTHSGVGKGLYEVLSQVYLPYTFCAMLNLIDFSLDAEIVQLATEVADMIVYQLALGTTDQGVSSLTASARHFPRCRLRVWGHNVNQLMLIVTGVSVCTFKVETVTGFLLTSKYRPDSTKLDFNDLIKTEKTVSNMRMNHHMRDIDVAYAALSETERIPFYW